MGSVFHHLKPYVPRKPTIITNHNSLLMLDAWRAKVTWPFHSSNACCWSSACQSNIWWLEYELSCSHCAANSLKARVLKRIANGLFWCWIRARILKGIQIWPKHIQRGWLYLTRVCCMADSDPNWSTMVLKGNGLERADEYTFCNNLANTRGKGLSILTQCGHL